MVFKYKEFGVFASIALLVNLMLIITGLSLLGSTLTLPGIAGIVLTVGMSVDANVLIFERIKEVSKALGGQETRKKFVKSIEDGFKTSVSTILDSNLTTLVTAFALYFVGFGPIKGFAVTLILGILTSMFSSMILTGIMLRAFANFRKYKIAEMSVFNIPLSQDLLKTFKDYIFQTYSEFEPNFSQFLVIVPSKQMENRLKIEFASRDIIAPKIISIAGIDEDFLFSCGVYAEFFESMEISELQTQILLYEIVKEHFPDFSFGSCFAYIQDFLELENMLLISKTEIAESVMKLEGTIANFSESLQNSLIAFLKILQKWQTFKSEKQKITRFERNVFSIESLITNLSLLDYKQIYILGASGTNTLQQELIRKIATLPNGNIFLSGLEIEDEKKLGVEAIFNLFKSLEKPAIFINPPTPKEERKIHFAEF